jgi:CheY-like chemotaxis protein
MSKIMLVEDDNNLREIYEARLLAEGYEIVSAHDGEEALALAVKEKPDLIISDVMMPKISGFDMLDILRSTPETKDTKVIMMTALSQAEDKSRADKLGADRYLVKSQVTLEDVAKIAREVLEGISSSPAPSSSAMPAPAPITDSTNPTTPMAEPVVITPAPAPTPEPVAVAPEPAEVSVPTPTPTTPVTSPTPPMPEGIADALSTSSEKATVDAQVQQFVAQVSPADPAPATDTTALSTPSPVPEPVAIAPDPTPMPAPVTDSTTPAAPPSPNVDMPQNINGKKVVQPINDPTAKPDLNQLLADEERKTAATGTTITPSSPAPADTSPGQDPNLIAL